MVSRFCVSCFICPPVCLQYISSTASVLTSSLSAHISLLQHGGQRGSQSEQRPHYATAELAGILPRAGVKSPFVWRVVKWGSSWGGMSKEGVFGPWGERVRPRWLVGRGEKTHWIFKQKSLPEKQKDRQREKNRCPRLCGSCYLLALSTVGGKFEVWGPESSQIETIWHRCLLFERRPALWEASKLHRAFRGASKVTE